MTREEMINSMMEMSSDGASELHMRSETLQRGNRVSRFPSLKKKLKKKSKLLLICELAVPFDPETGQPGKFNKDNKWRPPFSATTVAKVLKGNADNNPELKEMLMKRAGVREWNTADYNTINETDIKVFLPYRVPRVFTVPVVSVNIPAIAGGRGFAKDFAIDVEYDKTGMVVGEKPGALKVNDLFSDIAYEEIAELDKQINSGELQLTDQQVKDKKQAIRNKILVSGVHPANYVTMVEIPMTAKLNLSADFTNTEITEDVISDAVVISRYSKKMRLAMEEYVNGNYEKFDYVLDYVELDMECPTDGDESSNSGKQQIGSDTTYSKPASLLNGESCYDAIRASLESYLDKNTDVEEKVYRSIYVTPYSSEVEDQIYTSLHTVLDIANNEYVTKSVLQKHAAVISLAYGDEGDDLLMDLQAGMSDKKDGALEDSTSETVSDKAKYDLDSPDFASSFDEVNVDE